MKRFHVILHYFNCTGVRRKTEWELDAKDAEAAVADVWSRIVQRERGTIKKSDYTVEEIKQ